MFNEKPERQVQAELEAERQIDSLRKALAISDERCRAQAEEIAALTAEAVHLREGIAIYHKDYEYACDAMSTKNRSVEDWRERDKNRANGRQLEIPALCQACNPEWAEYRCASVIDNPSGDIAPKGTRCTRERGHPGAHQAGPALWREAPHG